MQFGIAQGCPEYINYAYLKYLPQWEKIHFTFKLGYLPTYGETPWGIHMGLYRNFKYIRLGGFYERRLNQNTTGEIGGITFGIIGPPKLAKFLRNFNVHFLLNSNKIWMMIPVVQLKIQHKD
jgi:hypothetical protein